MGTIEGGEREGADRHYHFFLRLHEHCRLLWQAVHQELAQMQTEDSDAAAAARQDKRVSQVGKRQREFWPSGYPTKQVPQAPLPSAEPTPTAFNDVKEGDNWLEGLGDDDAESGSQYSANSATSQSEFPVPSTSQQHPSSGAPQRTVKDSASGRSRVQVETSPLASDKDISSNGLSAVSTSHSKIAKTETFTQQPSQSDSVSRRSTKLESSRTSVPTTPRTKSASNVAGSGSDSGSSRRRKGIRPTTSTNSITRTQTPNMETSGRDPISTGKAPRKSPGGRGSSSSTGRKQTESRRKESETRK